ncbi:MAG TPA: FAD-dependent oxidoreductase [Myxococcota bacterium]|nr:FAD-dependent oxidoreductase [Myxococcota bacterium]
MVDPDDGVVHDWNLDRWNDIELRQLLKDHGGSPEIVDHWSGLRMIYDSTFQYRGGDPRQPDFAAGTGTRAMLRTMTTYKGSVLYHLAAGAGEMVISPLYEVLKSRGVRFAFFHDVEHLHVHRGRVRGVRIRQQADNTGFEPTFVHNGLVSWPHRSGVPGELERRWGRPEGVGTLTLREGQDFDDIVLAIPLGALRHRNICDELRVHEPFGRMLDAPSLVPTASLQLWMNSSLSELGWERRTPALVGWTHPLSVWAEMSHLLRHEEGEFGSLHYLCGPLDTDLYTSEESPVLRARTLARLRILKQLERDPPWPSKELPADHYLRVNIDPSECVVRSPAGSVAMRLAPSESGFGNLALAGAWTRTGVDASSVESAVMSGMQAARHLSGEDIEVVGEGFMGPG